MANPELLKMLRSGTRIWNDWRRAEIHGEDPSRELMYPSSTLSAKPDVGVADLRGAELSTLDLRGAELEHCSLEGANLEGTDLSRSNLSWTCLGEANLKGANLRSASLNGTYASFAKFDRAILVDATICNSVLHIASFVDSDLSGADLRDSDLRDADLRNANLRKANLFLTKFIGTKLEGADMHGAVMGRTILSGVNLSSVVGLGGVAHQAPSSVGSDTLYLFPELIPKEFLRGAGIQEDLIRRLSSLSRSITSSFYSCFVSYSHEQKPFAKKLCDSLQRRGIRCWRDDHEMLPGDDIYDEVDEGIRHRDKILLCCSRESLSSWWVVDEIDKALEKERILQSRLGAKAATIIPLNLDNFLFEGWRNGRAATLRRRFASDFVGWESDPKKFKESVTKLAQALRMKDIRRPTTPKIT